MPSSPLKFTFPPPALTNQQLQLKILNQLWWDWVISCFVFFSPLSTTSLLHRAHRDTSFVRLVSPFLQSLLKLKGHSGERRDRARKVVVGRKNSKISMWWFFQGSLSWSWASHNTHVCSIRHAASRNAPRSSSRFWSGHSLPALA